MSEKILIVEIPDDYKRPRTQADLDALRAEDVSTLEDPELAAAFARLVAGKEMDYIDPRGKWYAAGLTSTCCTEYGFTLATIEAIQARGWVWGIQEKWETCWAWVRRPLAEASAPFTHPDPGRALMTAAVLAAIAERDSG